VFVGIASGTPAINNGDESKKIELGTLFLYTLNCLHWMGVFMIVTTWIKVQYFNRRE
jgi:hypothetical protein